MSVEALTWAFSIKVGHPTRKLVLIALADHAGFNHQCWPSQAKLAERAECSVDTVQRHLSAMEDDGLITRTTRGKQGGGRSSDLYTLNVDSKGRESNGRNLRHKGGKAAPMRGSNPAPMPGTNTAPMRQEPSIEPSIEPSKLAAAPDSEKSQPVRIPKEIISQLKDCGMAGQESFVAGQIKIHGAEVVGQAVGRLASRVQRTYVHNPAGLLVRIIGDVRQGVPAFPPKRNPNDSHWGGSITRWADV